MTRAERIEEAARAFVDAMEAQDDDLLAGMEYGALRAALASPADAPRDDAPRCGCNPTRTPSGTGWIHHGNCTAPADEYARKRSFP